MATMNAYVDALKDEFNKYAIALKNLSKIDYATFFTAENLTKMKNKFLADSQKTIDNVVWNDKFIMIVIMIHALLVLEIIQNRKSYFKQIFYVISLIILSFSSTFLNNLGAENWNKFATKNYFDKNGKFMLLFLNIPVLIELILCLFFICISSLGILSPSKSKSKKSKPVKRNVKKIKQEVKKPVKEQHSKGNIKPEKKPVKINRKKFN